MIYWIFTTEYPPLFGGGISTYCYEAARMHTTHGDKVTVFIPDDQVNDFEIRQTGEVRIVAFNSNRSKLAAHLGHIPRLSYEFAVIAREFIRKDGKPDFIEAQEYLAIAYYTLQLRLLKDPAFDSVPVILVLHSPAFLYLYYNREGIYEFPNYWTGELEISCIRAADHVIAPSQYIVDEIRKHIPIDDVKVSVLRNPFRFNFVQESTGLIQRNRIVFFGKLSPQKGVFELFEYFKVIWDSGRKHVLDVVGGTDKVYYPEMKTMGQLIESKYETYIRQGLVRFKGRISPAEKDVVLSDAHVVLIPSLNDNLPYAAIEAMSLGKVILASKQGGQAELIRHGENGFLFDHGIPGDFAVKLEEVLALGDNQLVRIGVAAAETIRNELNQELIYQAKSGILKSVSTRIEKKLFPFTRPLHGIEKTETLESATTGNELLSVVVPYYNMGPYIDECINSVLASSYDKLEVLIVNDGSTDSASKDALHKWSLHPRVKILDKLNQGLAETRNYGAKHASGTWLAFLDADDTVHPDYYSKAIEVMRAYHNVHFVGSWVRYFGTKSDLWPTWNPEPPYILLHNTMNTSALVYKKHAFLAAGINDKKVDYGLEDYGSLIGLMANGYRGVVLPEQFFNYRIRPDSMYRSLTRYKAMYSHQYLSGKYPDLYRFYATDIFNIMNANGPSFAYDNPSFGIRVTSTVVGNSGFINNLKMFVKKNPALKKVLLQAKAMIKF